MNKTKLLRLGTIMSLLTLSSAIAGCKTEGSLLDDIRFPAVLKPFPEEKITVNPRVVPNTDLDAKRESRALNAVVLINDRELQTALEGLCIDLGFRPVASKAERNRMQDTKNDWFSDVVQEIRDRKELYAGADVVLMGHVPTYNSVRRSDAPKTDTVEVVVYAYSVGTAEMWLHTTATLEGSGGIFVSDDPTRLKRFERICKAIKVELDKKAFSGAIASK